jgi:hypothetical protein
LLFAALENERAMRRILLCFVLVVAVSSACADPLESSSPEPVLPDPKPDNGVHFAPNAATRDTARPSVELSSAGPLGARACSALNPFAALTPALGGSKPPPPSQAN